MKEDVKQRIHSIFAPVLFCFLLVGVLRLSGRSCNVMPHGLRLESSAKPTSKKHLSDCPDDYQMLEEEVT